MANLTDKQKYALYQMVKGIKDGKPKITLGGYAGTGKTTITKFLTKFLPNFGVCAYTGKAANVLRRKGINASTIHSRIYEPDFKSGKVEFVLKPHPGCNGFIVDEASMVSEEIYEDLKQYGLPMIYIGDHGQLEPVGSDFNLMINPDIVLEEIHRNAGSIARFAEHLRKGLAARGFRERNEKVEFLSKWKATDTRLAEADQVICAYNKTRVATNNKIRKKLGHTGILNVGERVMCLRNNRQEGLFNGMQGEVVGLSKGKRGAKYMEFLFDGVVYEVKYESNQFGKEKYDIEFGKETPNPFDYAYCITAHKAQGDEWGKVMVLEQKCRNWDHKRWAYTAASRAREKLEWVLG